MAIHTPTRRIPTRRYVAERESQSNGVEEKRFASTNLPGNLESRIVKEVESETPGTESTASTPDTVNSVWDSPLPSSHHLRQSSSHVALTPLTPQSAYGSSPDSDPAFHARKDFLEQSVKEKTASDTVATLHAKLCAKPDLLAHANLEEDYFFEPKKLIRNLTKELQAIAEANAATGQPGYSLRPDFNFWAAVAPYTSAQPAVLRSDVKKEVSKCDMKAVCTEAVHNRNSLPSTRTSIKPLYPDLEHIIPMSIQSRVIEHPGECVASLVVRPHEKCTAKVLAARIAIKSWGISGSDVEVDPSKFLGNIEQLIQTSMCGTHRRAALSRQRQEKLEELVTSFAQAPGAEHTEFLVWVDAITSSKRPERDQASTVHITRKDRQSAASKTCKPRDVTVAPSATKSSLTTAHPEQVYLTGFLAYQPKSTRHLSVSNALREEIMKPLLPSALKDGFIYIFWDLENFGAVKIGRTNNLARRLADWNRGCNRTHMYHPASQRGELSEIPHVSRIERLIHIELKQCRKQRWCESCGKNHIEWFVVGEALVTQIFRKWHDWIMQKPYALNAITKKWELRPEMIDTLNQVCGPVAGVEKQQPLRRAGGAKRGTKAKRQTI